MFLLKNSASIPGSSGYSKLIVVPREGQNDWRMCHVHTWGFSSCAVMHLQGFQILPEDLQKKFDIEQFLDFLKLIDDTSWKPQEAMFLLSDQQLNHASWYKTLCKHPNVKRIDRFENKAHGPNHVNLFRWSAKNDFKRVRKYV